MTDTLIMVFLKPFIQGKVKTRLATGIGEANALKVYRCLVDLTLLQVKKIQLHADVKLFYSEATAPEFRDTKGFDMEIQTGKDLGIRMLNAMRYGQAHGYGKLIVIGTDCPEINADLLLQAIRELDEHDLVLGPAKDGGYYLLGIKEVHQALFMHIPWSTEKVLEETLKIAGENELKPFLLKSLSDVDDLNDLQSFPEILRQCDL